LAIVICRGQVLLGQVGDLFRKAVDLLARLFDEVNVQLGVGGDAHGVDLNVESREKLQEPSCQ
jgi:hypothetical protein